MEVGQVTAVVSKVAADSRQGTCGAEYYKAP